MTIKLRGPTWWIDIQEAGQRVREKGGDTKAEAEKHEANTRLLLKAGAYIKPVKHKTTEETGETKKPGKYTLGEALDTAYSERWEHLRDTYTTGRRIAWLKGAFPGLEMTSLGRALPSIVKKLREEGKKEPTIRRYMSILSVAARMAHEAGYCEVIEVSAIKSTLRESEGRSRIYSPEEIQQILFILSNRESPKKEHLVRFFMFLFYTGARTGEALKITRGDIKNNTVCFPALITKGKKLKTLPINAELGELLKEQLATIGPASTTKVYPLNAQIVKRSWRLVRARMGAEADAEFVPHGIRHTVATELVRTVPAAVAQKWLGHAQLSTTMRYIHLGTDDLQEASAALSTVCREFVPFVP